MAAVCATGWLAQQCAADGTMDVDRAIDLVRSATFLAFLIGSPVLVVSLAASLVLGVLQAATQVQEPVLTFVPRLIVAALAALLVLPWAVQRLVEYSTALFHEVSLTIL